MTRISQKMIEAQIEQLNKIFDDKSFELSCAYGGYCLHQFTDKKTGARADVFKCGHIPARSLYFQIRAFLIGLDYAARHLSGD